MQDYIYAGDAARANLMAMASQASGTGMNIVSGVDTSQNRVVELVLKACKSDLKPEYYTDPNKLLMPLQTKQGYSRARAKELLDWEPQVSIEEGVNRLVTWLDQHRSLSARPRSPGRAHAGPAGRRRLLEPRLDEAVRRDAARARR